MNICITNTVSLFFFGVVPIEVCLIVLLVVFSQGPEVSSVCVSSPISPQQSLLKAAAKNLKKTGVKAHFLTDILLFTHSQSNSFFIEQLFYMLESI